MNGNRAAATLLAVLAFKTFFAMGIASAKVVSLTSGAWTVERSPDSMTDKITCVGYHKSSRGVQLYDTKLFISIRGGLQSVTLRFGDQPARPMRLASEIEKKIGSIVIERSEFVSLIEETRLRAQVLTLASGLVSPDLDLSGLKIALAHIRAGCPPNDTATQEQGQDEPSKKTRCDETLIARLKKIGLREEQISVACRK